MWNLIARHLSHNDVAVLYKLIGRLAGLFIEIRRLFQHHKLTIAIKYDSFVAYLWL